MELTPRQALICAALTGWKSDGPTTWQCPMPERDIVAWGASYLGSEEGLAEAFATLAKQGLFHRVLYPTFAVPVYYCSYDDRYLDELPEHLSEVVAGCGSEQRGIPWENIDDLKDFWSAEFDENGDKYAETWIYWGLCHGQGSQSGSSPTGPCLGPGCSWFKDGKATCQWELPFADVPRTGWPDMEFLSTFAENADEDAVEKSLAAWRKKTPEFAWDKP